LNGVPVCVFTGAISHALLSRMHEVELLWTQLFRCLATHFGINYPDTGDRTPDQMCSSKRLKDVLLHSYRMACDGRTNPEMMLLKRWSQAELGAPCVGHIAELLDASWS
jgi:hypothetical protein